MKEMKGKPSPVEFVQDGVPWTCAGLAILFALLLDSRLSGVQYLPWVVGLLFFGLPHGACDHLVAAKITGRGSAADMVTFFALYLAAAATMILLWLASPAVALLTFLVLTAWHWGSADAVIQGGGPGRFYVASVARGLLVISAPVAFDPAASWTAFEGLMSVFTQAPAESPAWLAPLAVGFLILSVGLEFLLVSVDFARGYRSRVLGGLVELLLLLGLFWLVSPVAAVGIYFVFWHAWRHVLRTGALLRSLDVRRGATPLSLVIGYHIKALPLMLLSLVMLVLLSVVLAPSGPVHLVSVYLVLISALTVPHAVLVFFWDLGTIKPESEAR